MKTVHRSIAAALIVAVLAAEPSCSTGNSEPPAPPPPAVVNEVPAAALATFQVRVYSADEIPVNVHRDFTAYLTALAADGEPHVFDTDTGEPRENPQTINNVSPYEHRVTMGPGVVSVSLTITTYLRAGEILACWVEQVGEMLPNTDNHMEAPTELPSDAAIPASVSCFFAMA